MNQKEKVKLMFDYLQGPIWTSDIKTGEPLTGIDIIDDDKVLPNLNLRCSELYSECYEFDTNNQPCIFNVETAKKNKKEILKLLTKIKERLEKINDGSFYVEDLATTEIGEIKKDSIMEELDCVKLIKPFKDLEIGTEGTILIKYNEEDYEVEFVDDEKDTIGVYTISKDYLKVTWKYSEHKDN